MPERHRELEGNCNQDECVLTHNVATCCVCDRHGARVGTVRLVPVPASCP